MTCRSCRRDNAANRRYCGGCGTSLIAACGGCGFSNALDDRYCGGCGTGLGTVAVATRQPATKAQSVEIAITSGIPDELQGLFDPAAPEPAQVALPQAGIGQDDLDKLFGVDA
jgi:hypothetical protein